MPRIGAIIKRGLSQSDITITTVAEQVVGNVLGISTQSADERVELHGWAQVTTGAAATALTARIRRGPTAADPLVGEANPVQVAAGQTVIVDIDVQDAPGEVAGQTYCLTVQQTAATGNGASLQSELRATIGGE